MVTDRRDSFLYPSLSPDGLEIAYQLDPGIPQIWRYDIERDDPELLVSGDTSNLDPLWTPDGRHIVFQFEKLVWDLHWQSMDDRTEEVLLEVGYSWEDIERLRSSGIVGHREPSESEESKKCPA